MRVWNWRRQNDGRAVGSLTRLLRHPDRLAANGHHRYKLVPAIGPNPNVAGLCWAHEGLDRHVSEPRLVPNPNWGLAVRALSKASMSLRCSLEHAAEHRLTGKQPGSTTE